MRTPLYCLVSLLCSFFLTHSSLAQADAQRSENGFVIAGSDLMGDAVVRALEAAAAGSDLNLSLSFEGSAPALAALRAGDADVAIVAVTDQQEPPGFPFTTIALAYQVTVVAVHPDNPIGAISLRQLRGIYGRSEESSLTRWNDLGLTTWQARGIKPVSVQSLEDGVALDLFRYSVLSNPELKSSVTLFEDPAQAISYVQRDNGAISLLSFVPEESAVKVLLVSRMGSGPGFGPTATEVHAGEYPMRLPLYLVFEQAERERLTPLLRLLLSDEVAGAVVESRLLPVPREFRRSALLELELGR